MVFWIQNLRDLAWWTTLSAVVVVVVVVFGAAVDVIVEAFDYAEVVDDVVVDIYWNCCSCCNEEENWYVDLRHVLGCGD
jgi:hypothetical protein